MFFIDDKDLIMVINSNQWNLHMGKVSPCGEIIWSHGIRDLHDYKAIKEAAKVFVASLK